jgi:hypothetical protein
LLAASAVAYTQLISVIPIETIAADNDTAPDETYAEVILGDVNGDGKIDSVDSNIIRDYVCTGDDSDMNILAADVDVDGKVTLRDAEIILQNYALLSVGSDPMALPFSGELTWKYYPDPANYEIVNEGMTWNEAEEYCESKGAHLAAITSDYEQAQIEALIKKQPTIKNNYWIGLKRTDKNGFEWVTKESRTFNNWNPGAPNSSSQTAVSLFGNPYEPWGGSGGQMGRYEQ